jgi:antitoxin CcdA
MGRIKVNLTVDAEVAEEARALGLNMSRLAEAAIAEALDGNEEPYFAALRASLACDVLDETAVKARRSVEGNAKLDAAKAAALKAYWRKFVEARKPVTWPQSIQRACRVS